MRGWIPSPWFPLVSAFLLILSAAYIATSGDVPQWIEAYKSNPREFTELLIALAGWLLALTGLLFAGKDTKRGMAFEAIAKLQGDESDPEQAEAKRLISKEVAPLVAFSGNPYSNVRKWWKELKDSPDQFNDLDKARRRLTHFWYRAATLVDLDMLDSRQVFKSIGPPDILSLLERLETIVAESINPNWQPEPWPPMSMLIAWYKQKGHRQKASQLRPELPSQPHLYEQSRSTGESEPGDKDSTPSNSKS